MSLQEESLRISANLHAWYKQLVASKTELMSEIFSTTEVLKEAAAMGDLRENAEFTDATNKLSSLRKQLSSVASIINRIENLKGEKEYQSMGLVVVYSTVKLKCITTGETFVLKLYPAGISSIDLDILPQSSPVGNAIWLKAVNDEIIVENRMTAEPVKYVIEDIY